KHHRAVLHDGKRQRIEGSEPEGVVRSGWKGRWLGRRWFRVVHRIGISCESQVARGPAAKAKVPKNINRFSELGFDAARSRQAPAARRFKQNEQPDRHQRQANPKFKIGHDDSGDQQDRPEHSAHNPALKTYIAMEETTHTLLII